jgi:hypothetical protein
VRSRHPLDQTSRTPLSFFHAPGYRKRIYEVCSSKVALYRSPRSRLMLIDSIMSCSARSYRPCSCVVTARLPTILPCRTAIVRHGGMQRH